MVCIVPPKKAEYQDSGAQHSRNIIKGPKGKYKIKIKYQTVLGFKDFNATRATGLDNGLSYCPCDQAP
jgi:hypothetical protein